MDGVNCTSCGKQLLDGDWVSKSGLCRACAEAKHDGSDLVRKRRANIVVILLAVIFVSLVVLIYVLLPPPLEKMNLSDYLSLAAYIDDDDHAFFVGVTEEKANWNDKQKLYICSDLYTKYVDDYPDIDVITVLLALPDSDTAYDSFVYEDGDVYNIDPLIGLAALGSAMEADKLD